MQSLSDLLVDAATVARNTVKEEIDKHGSVLESGNFYQSSLSYLLDAMIWNLYNRKLHVMETIVQNIKKDKSVLDLGCASGVTGLVLLKLGYDVSFSDFSGAPQLVINRLEPKRFFPYGKEPVCDWVVALDVIEHVANPLSFVRWIYELCHIGAIVTYPILPVWQPPYQKLEIDNYVDTELLLPVIRKLFRISYMTEIDGGHEFVLRRK